jgi:glycosyltransferase involved in cell wall biosynthesis
MSVPHIYVDASPLAKDRFSGVGHYTLGVVRGFEQLAAEGKLEYSLIVESGRADILQKYRLNHYKRIIRSPFSARTIRWMTRLRIPLNLDWVFGRGHYYFPDFITWRLSRRSTATTVVHDMTYRAVPESVDEKNLKYLEQIVPITLKRATNIVAVSEFSKSEIVKYYGTNPSHITVVHAAVDRDEFYRRGHDEVAAVKAKYGLPDGKYILTLGNIEPRKNHARLLDAFASLPREIADEYALVLVGAGGWKNSDLFEKISKLKGEGYHIIIPEKFVEDEDRPALFSGAELFVLPSLYEGFGMQVLEALACGTRVLTSSTSSLPEVAGDAAFYTDPTDAGKIADDLQKLLTDEESKDPGSIEQQVAKFSWDTSAKTTAAIIIETD